MNEEPCKLSITVSGFVKDTIMRDKDSCLAVYELGSGLG